jgi:hypothetical protein
MTLEVKTTVAWRTPFRKNAVWGNPRFSGEKAIYALIIPRMERRARLD